MMHDDPGTARNLDRVDVLTLDIKGRALDARSEAIRLEFSDSGIQRSRVTVGDCAAYRRLLLVSLTRLQRNIGVPS
jgi:hypothetical protein